MTRRMSKRSTSPCWMTGELPIEDSSPVRAEVRCSLRPPSACFLELEFPYQDSTHFTSGRPVPSTNRGLPGSLPLPYQPARVRR